ncbi:acetolactate decarboxylase [Ascidiimonas aurantiaca]|uniref:acetolactate decarboxylase n=1 Tax=Ascidiimonas aurantiaca TaxID=1685432 RepID=UPI0030ECF07F
MKHIITGIILMLCQVGFSQQVINGFSMPESIISDGKRFFVSNQGQDFMNKDGGGFISEISADGKIVNQRFLPVTGVLNAPKGMTIVNNILFVADLDRVAGFNIDNRQTVFELIIEGAKLLNDICQLEDGFIAVTETVSGNIYKVNINSKSVEIIANIPTVNGIAYNQKTKQLLVCSNGENYGDGSIYLKSDNSEFEELPNITNGFFDGIEWIDNDHILISDWITFPVNGSGKLWIYDLKDQQSQFNITEESIADIFYDIETSKIYMPQMLHNRVLISDWEQLSKTQDRINHFYNYGVIDAFIGGLYRGTLPLKDLKLKGDFGLGAPDMLNGELTIVDGRAYQTMATGETVELDNDHLTSFASVTFFKADTTFIQNLFSDKSTVLNTIEKILPNKNKMYAIKISGKFEHLKTRAFPPVENEPFPKLANILDQQQFFDYQYTDGTLIGFFLPSYLNGINAGGFHFHFLSNDRKKGGHILEFAGKDLKIEIATLKTFEMNTPNDKAFQNFEFIKTENESLRKVEQGKQ